MTKVPPLAKLILICFALEAFAGTVQAQLYVTNVEKGTICEYDATTGALINDSFVSGLANPRGLAYADGYLYVVNSGRRMVGKYDAKTGELINDALVTGLDFPEAIAVSGHNLFVTSMDGMGTGRVGKYDAVTGAEIHYELVAKLQSPLGLAVWGDHLFVANGPSLGVIGEYDATTGVTLHESFIRGVGDPGPLAQSENYLWVLHGTGAVTKHSCDSGENVMGLMFPLVSGLDYPSAIAVSGDDLFIGSFRAGTIGKYNASTGAVINASFIFGLNSFGSLAVVPAPAASGSGTFWDSWALLFDRRGYANTLVTLSDGQLTAICVVLLLLVVVGIIGVMFILRAKYNSLHEKVFPRGLKKVTIGSFAGVPAAGCSIVSDSVPLQIAGLQVGDIIVALEGFRIENEEQYAHIDAMTTDPNMNLIVWRDDRYVEIWAWVRDRKLDASLQTYTTPSP